MKEKRQDVFFVKYGKKRYLQDIIDGQIRFAPVFTYRKYEQSCYENGIFDPYYGMGRIVTNELTYLSEDGVSKSLNGKITINIDLVVCNI